MCASAIRRVGYGSPVDIRGAPSYVADVAEEVQFEWDEVKATSNFAKHGVRFQAALRVFADPSLVLLDVSRTVDGEPRFKAVGDLDGRLHTVVHTFRGDVVRVISARRANASEEDRYDRPSHV